MLPVQQHDVEVIGVRELAQLVDLLLRIHAFAGGDLRHQPVAVARNALQRDAQHSVHVAVGLGGFEEADAAVVGVAHQPREAVLSQVALHLAAEGAGAEREPRHLHAGFSQRHPIGRAVSRRRFQREASRCRQGAPAASPVFRNSRLV